MNRKEITEKANKMKEEIKDPSEIDIYNLDTQWRIYPKQFKEASEDLANAQDKLRDKKSHYKYMKAQIAVEYRKGIRELKDENEKVIKITDKSMSDILDFDQELREIDIEINKLQREVDMHNAWYETMRAKKYGLQDAVRLYISDYFSRPHVDVTDEEAKVYEKNMEEVEKEIEVSERRERRRRRANSVED